MEKRFFEILRALAAATKTDLTPFAIDRYKTQLEPLGFERVNEVLMTCFDEIGGHVRQMPSINQIKEKLGVKNLSADEIAKNAIQRVREAVSRFGYCNPEAAMAFIGPVGQRFVKSMGGWVQTCSFETYKEMDFAFSKGLEPLKIAIMQGADIDEPVGYEGFLENKNTKKMLDELMKNTKQLSDKN